MTRPIELKDVLQVGNNITIAERELRLDPY